MGTHQLPLVSTYYLVGDFLFAFKFLRIYFVIRAVFNYVQYMDLYSKKLCKKYGFTASKGWDAASGLGTPNYEALSKIV